MPTGKQNSRVVGLIPLRRGSKSIPQKNIKEIAGKPLAYWTCKAAAEAQGIERVYVSTEDAEIKRAIDSFKLGVEVIDRPNELAQDDTPTESVMLHFAKVVTDWDVLMTLQATSPLTAGADIDAALRQFEYESDDSMLTGVRVKRFFWTLSGKPLNYDHWQRPRRQDFTGSIVENGAFYLTKRAILLNEKNRLGGKIGIHEMSPHTLAEIDEPEDWDMIERLLLARLRDSISKVTPSQR
jgi:N-acylneuraminate cytidylyltransferase